VDCDLLVMVHSNTCATRRTEHNQLLEPETPRIAKPSMLHLRAGLIVLAPLRRTIRWSLETLIQLELEHFRSSFRDWAASHTGYPRDAAEAAAPTSHIAELAAPGPAAGL
jgi:hypothetical protein